MYGYGSNFTFLIIFQALFFLVMLVLLYFFFKKPSDIEGFKKDEVEKILKKRLLFGEIGVDEYYKLNSILKDDKSEYKNIKKDKIEE